MEIIKAENIFKTYGDYTALNNVSISVQKKSVFGLIGPNGAGKTTTMKIITAEETPTNGTVSLY